MIQIYDAQTKALMPEELFNNISSYTYVGVKYTGQSTGDGKFKVTLSGKNTNGSVVGVGYVFTVDVSDMQIIYMESDAVATANKFRPYLCYILDGKSKFVYVPYGSKSARFVVPYGATSVKLGTFYYYSKDETVNRTYTYTVRIGSPNTAMNGDVLQPTSCQAEMKLNGDWTLEMTHPLDTDGKHKLIEYDNILSVPTPVNERSLYRIYQTKKTNTSITAYARPIFYDAGSDIFLLDSRPTDKTGQEALDILMDGTIYSGESDIAEKSTAYYINKSLINALQSDDENSFLNRWGGEIIYDNFKIIINYKTGADNGIKAEFGRNLNSIEETVSTDDIITRIVPMAYNGYMLDGDSPWVDSQYIDKYPLIYTKLVKFEDVKLSSDAQEDEEGFDTLDDLRKELKRRAQLEFDAGCDLPSMNYVIDMIDLSRTEEYKDYQQLETVNLGDTIHCKYKPLDIEVDARVIRIKYDCILQKNDEIELGDEQYDYFSDMTQTTDAVTSILNDDGTVRGSAVQGVLDALNVKLSYQKSVAQKQDVRAILFEDTDPSSATYGALAIGTLGLQISTKKKTDGEWDWTTAITAKGAYANVVAAGTMLADRIQGGTLTLGGASNQRGILYALTASGEEGVMLDNGGLVIYDEGKKAIQLYGTSFKNDADTYGTHLGISDGARFFNISVKEEDGYFYPRLTINPTTYTIKNDSGSSVTYYAGVNVMRDIHFHDDQYFGGELAKVYAPYTNRASTLISTGRYCIEGANGDVLQDWDADGDESAVYTNSFNLKKTEVLMSSDERLKENIETADVDALDLVNNMQFYSYDWIESGKHVEMGFIAQQLEAEVAESLINVDANGEYSVKEMEMIPYLAKAIQELSTQVSSLKNEIAELTGESMASVKKAPRKRWAPTSYTLDEKNAFIASTKPVEEEMKEEEARWEE